MVEQIPDPEAEPIVIETPVFSWQHVRRVGEDLVRGEMVLAEGTEITPWAQGALLAAGVTRVSVRRAPKVAIIPTGSELVPAAELPKSRSPGACRSSIRLSCRVWWRSRGAKPPSFPSSPMTRPCSLPP